MYRVYPRGHGESQCSTVLVNGVPGLSPWARGILHRAQAGRAVPGSIPVGTGNPSFRRRHTLESRVYPRGHGESAFMRALASPYDGLSPWARGIQLNASSCVPSKGSIPVGTGNPCSQYGDCRKGRVYPRGHGESAKERVTAGKTGGLSPWARGIPVDERRDLAGHGSIPVGTGNPYGALFGESCIGVYPRGHGESGRHGAGISNRRGLSPWARGILSLERLAHPRARSIPVGTGNPLRKAPPCAEYGVYPRGHGESVPIDGQA